MSKKRFLFDAQREDCYVRAWKEGRGRNAEVLVHVWLSEKPVGDPDGDWAMPGVLGVEASIDQSVINTKSDGPIKRDADGKFVKP